MFRQLSMSLEKKQLYFDKKWQNIFFKFIQKLFVVEIRVYRIYFVFLLQAGRKLCVPSGTELCECLKLCVADLSDHLRLFQVR